MLNIAEINLSILRENAKEIKKRLPSSTKFCAVVKADAYGHGACEVANALYNAVDCFAVSLLEEAVALRHSGIDKDILLLIPPFKEDATRAVFYSLTLAVADEKTALLINREAKRQGRKVKVHIKVNTGMNRQGVSLQDLQSLLKTIALCDNIILEGVFSHFACPEDKKRTELQLNKFLLAIKLTKRYNKNIIKHVSASGGFLKGQYFDMVRIGILLYGYKPFEDKIKVKPIMKVKCPVLKTQKLKKGDGVLYGKSRVKRNENSLLLRFGYADGLPRERFSDLLNNRCMDISAYRGKSDKEWHYILNGNADKLAKKYRTISYEILCKITIRAKKVYKD